MTDDIKNHADFKTKDKDGRPLYGFEEIKEVNLEWFKDKSRIHYICMLSPPRPGVNLFASILEYKFYPPNTPKNAEFIMQILRWEGLVYSVISIPMKEKSYAEAVAKTVGMRIANGVPTMFDSPGEPKFFPVRVDHAFTIENEPGHPIYSSGAHAKRFLEVEKVLCDMIYMGGGSDVEQALEKIKSEKF